MCWTASCCEERGRRPAFINGEGAVQPLRVYSLGGIDCSNNGYQKCTCVWGQNKQSPCLRREGGGHPAVFEPAPEQDVQPMSWNQTRPPSQVLLYVDLRISTHPGPRAFSGQHIFIPRQQIEWLAACSDGHDVEDLSCEGLAEGPGRGPSWAAEAHARVTSLARKRKKWNAQSWPRGAEIARATSRCEIVAVLPNLGRVVNLSLAGW